MRLILAFLTIIMNISTLNILIREKKHLRSLRVMETDIKFIHKETVINGMN